MNSAVFQRHEIKYLLDQEQQDFLFQVMQGYMEPDPHGESTICNIYYDTPDYRLIRRSLEKPIYKEKLRIRSYGPAASSDMIFLELKKKFKGVVYKRRIELPQERAIAYLDGKEPLCVDSQIGREIDYFCRYYGGLKPAVHMCYDRKAFYSTADPDLRITLDLNIRWEDQHLSLSSRPAGTQLLDPGQSLLEIKTATALPLWLTHALCEADIQHISFSKYGTAYEAGLCYKPAQASNSYHLVKSRGYCHGNKEK